MKRVRKPVPTQISRGMLHAEGAGLKEARVKLEERVSDALQGRYSPHLIELWGQRTIVYRTPAGWEYAIARECSGRDAVTKDPLSTIGTTLYVGTGSEQQAIRQAVFGMAQAAYSEPGGDTTDFERAERLFDATGLGDSTEGVTLKQWLHWQVSYATGIKLGLDRDTARVRADKQGIEASKS